MNRARLDVHRTQYLKADGTMEDCGLVFVISDDYFTQECDSREFVLEERVYSREEKGKMLYEVLHTCSGDAYPVLASKHGLYIIEDHFTQEEVKEIMKQWEAEEQP